MVDEAHRSQTSTLHANLMAALPNAAKIGFTGTPIMREGKKQDRRDLRLVHRPVHDPRGRGRRRRGADLLRGSHRQGRRGRRQRPRRAVRGHVRRAHAEELEKLKARYATTGAVLEAPKLIAAKATLDALALRDDGASGRASRHRWRPTVDWPRSATARHFWRLATTSSPRSRVCPRTSSRALLTAPWTSTASIDARRCSSARCPQLDLIRILDFVPVISGDHNDDPTWAQWTDKARQDAAIADFKKPLGPAGDKSSPVAFLLVRTMLLTGFDAPIEQVLYLDRFIQDAELLQAIARVNRTAPGKTLVSSSTTSASAPICRRRFKAYAPEDAADTDRARWHRSRTRCPSCATGMLGLWPCLRRRASSTFDTARGHRSLR